MRIRDRDVKRLLAAPLQPRHWLGLGRALSVYGDPKEALRRYLGNTGIYPWAPTLRTPMGTVRPVLTSYHDLLTVQEIFCRHDYGSARDVQVVVDVGANVGLAALFFLTRRPDVRVYCFEPDPSNTARLRQTLVGLEDRYVLDERAVTPDQRDSVTFLPLGRYGRVVPAHQRGTVVVPAASIMDVLTHVLKEVPHIDLVKVDTEGTEPALVSALAASGLRPRIGSVVYEDARSRTRWA